MRRALPVFFMSAVCLLGAAPAQSQTVPRPSATARSFVGPVLLRGTLGNDQIQVDLRPKADIEDGYEGDYFLFGSSLKILLAGDIDGEDFILEESENGTDISGQWDGKVAGDTITGSWQSVDGSVKKPFKITVLRVVEKTKPSASKSAR